MQPDDSSQSHAVPFTKKFTLKGLQYKATLDRIYERDGVKFFQSCCDLCFCRNGVLRDRKWSSISNDHTEVVLQTTGDGRTVVALKSSHMDVGYLVFSAYWLPIAYVGIWFFSLLSVEAVAGRGTSAHLAIAYFFKISAPLMVPAFLWVGYKKHCRFIERGLRKLLTAMQRFPAEINLKQEDYGAMLEALPASEKAPGVFTSYATSSADVRIMPDTPMHKVFCHKEGYLYRDHEGEVDVILVSRNKDTLLIYRARPDYPLGILIGIFTALWISWTYFVGYKYVIHYGASTALNNLATSGLFISFLLMLLTGFGILIFRKIRNDRAVKEAISTITHRLVSNQQGIF